MASRYWVGGTGSYSDTAHWSATSGGSGGASVPGSSDDAVFNGSSGAGVVTVDGAPSSALSVNFTGFTGTVTGASGKILRLYKGAGVALTLSSGATCTGQMTLSFIGSSGHIASNGVTIPWGITFANGTYLDDALATTGAIAIQSSSSVVTGGFSVTAASVSIAQYAGFDMGGGSATITLTGAGTVWDMNADGYYYNIGTSTIKLTNASSSAKLFAGGGKTYGDLWLTGAGTGEFQLSGSNTFADFKCDTPPHTIKFTAGTTTTVTTFTVSGTAGNLMTVGSLTASAHTLTKAGGGVIEKDYLSISNSTAGPSSTWYAGLNSSSGGNTSGWVFGTSSTVLNAGLFINSGP